jgi:hypothetical protein
MGNSDIFDYQKVSEGIISIPLSLFVYSRVNISMAFGSPSICQMTLICLFRFHSNNGPEINYGLSQPEGVVGVRHPP